MKSVKDNMEYVKSYIGYLLSFQEDLEENGERVYGYPEDEEKCKELFAELFKHLDKANEISDKITDLITECFGN
jgi:uncharacterized coiled-coil DUF342 family protein